MSNVEIEKLTKPFGVEGTYLGSKVEDLISEFQKLSIGDNVDLQLKPIKALVK